MPEIEHSTKRQFWQGLHVGKPKLMLYSSCEETIQDCDFCMTQEIKPGRSSRVTWVQTVGESVEQREV